MADTAITSSADFLRVSKALKEAGRTGLRRELHKGLKDAAKPLIAETRAAAREQLPKRGGLAELVAKEPQKVQVLTGAKSAGIRIVVGKRKGAARAANSGQIRHPVFGRQGDRGAWVPQSVQPGWFDHTLSGSAPKVEPHLLAAMHRVLETVAREG